MRKWRPAAAATSVGAGKYALELVPAKSKSPTRSLSAPDVIGDSAPAVVAIAEEVVAVPAAVAANVAVDTQAYSSPMNTPVYSSPRVSSYNVDAHSQY